MKFIIIIIIVLLSGGLERLEKYMKNVVNEKNAPGSAGKQEYRSIFEKYLAQVEEENHPWKQKKRMINIDPGKVATKRAQHTSPFSTDVKSSAAEAQGLEGFEAEGYSLAGSSLEGSTLRGEMEDTIDTNRVNSNVALSVEPGDLSLPSAGSIPGGMDLKAAIIWSEILQKPKALRRRH